MDYLSKLNDMQRSAVKTTEGPLLLLAGAGSGKTRTVISRIAYIIENNLCKTYEILALTFTNKAAGEMRQRIADYGIPYTNEIWMGTFHSICARLLRMHCEAIGFNRSFTIYDETDSKKLVTECMSYAGLSDRALNANTILSAISKAKSDYILPEDYQKSFSGDFRSEKIARVYSLYNEKLKQNNAMDFDDLLLNTLVLFDKVPDVLAHYQSRFKYVSVDEYQDTNRLQYEIVSRIAARYKNICVCGDDDQSIYGWRGADINNILDFEKDFPNAKVIRLEQNYRSTKVILDAANAVIAHNEFRMGKKLWSSGERGDDIRLINAGRDLEEAQLLAHEISSIQRETKKYSDIAVLYRVNAQSRILEEGLIRAGIPYKIVGGTRFYDRQEVKDVIAYLKFAVNPFDTIALLRAIASPKRGLGPSSMEKVFAYADFKGLDNLDCMKNAESIVGLSSAQKEKLKTFAALIEKISLCAETDLKQAVQIAVEESGYMTFIKESTDEKKENRAENLKELVSAAGDFASTSEDSSLGAFLENAALVSGADDADTQAGVVLLMTMHNSKGLEFDTVFLPGMEEGYFPLARAAANPDELEEERRLCYVAITRAKKRLIISTAQYRMVYGSGDYRIPSRFISEIPQELIREEEFGGFKQTSSIYEKENIFAEQPAYSAKSFGGTTSKKVGFGFGEKKPILKKPAVTDESFDSGDRILHPSWGEGTVVSVNASGDDTLVTAAFAGLGIKKFILGVAKITKI